ncbi:MAG: hypothetical protein DRO99_03295 [Candidatus Aenigmatarchaeota archaeon]|nr:MAG: hypothetical protein DRO99_03295 [Candidatus Aenigmarchaeota archaeon]
MQFSFQYVKATGLFIAGIAVILYGLYAFFSMPTSMNDSIFVMIAGLVVAAIGSIHGHKTLRNPAFKKMLEEERKRREKEKEERKKRRLERKKKKSEANDGKDDKGVVKVIICPFCGEENKYSAVFCDECGKRLRPKK